MSSSLLNVVLANARTDTPWLLPICTLICTRVSIDIGGYGSLRSQGRRNDFGHKPTFSRHDVPEFWSSSAPKGVGNAGRLGAPAALRANGKSTQASHHRSAGSPGIPAREWF